MSERVWLITGASTGFGRAITEAALERGDRVVATARKPETLDGLSAQYPDRLLPLILDVTDYSAIETVVEQSIGAFGRVDVLVNNAGAGLVAALEEASDQQIERSFAANYFGAVKMMRAVLPHFRERKAGLIVNMSAVAGFANEMGFSIYGAAKFALEGTSEALASEVRPLGIKVTLVEPGPFRTDFIGRGLERGENHISDYDRTSGKFAAFLEKINGAQPGDPIKAAQAILKLADLPNPPMRLVLGKYAYDRVHKKLKDMTRDLDMWESLGIATDYE